MKFNKKYNAYYFVWWEKVHTRSIGLGAIHISCDAVIGGGGGAGGSAILSHSNRWEGGGSNIEKIQKLPP